MGGAWHGAGRELFLGLGPNNRNNGNNGVWLAVVVLVVSNRLLFKPGSLALALAVLALALAVLALALVAA